MAEQAYVRKKPRKESLMLMAAALHILEEFKVKMTVRQLYYQLVSHDIVPNTVRSYKRVVRVIKDGRMLGVIDWDYIEDRLRKPDIPGTWDDIDEIIEMAKQQFRLDRWQGQDYHVEVWLEKDALAGIVGDITRKFQVTLQVNRGYSSVTAMRDSALRMEAAADEGKQCIIGYFGDHDPSGEDMVRDVRDRLYVFQAPDVEVVKLAILNEDISKYNLPPQPVKASDSRAEAFRWAHGEDCVELDALRPDVLQKRVEDFILRHLDLDGYNAVVEEEDRQRASVRTERT